jgi:hypothetical protein
VSELVDRAAAWMRDVHPHFEHLDRALAWLIELEPDASEPARIAAVTHDSERAFDDPAAPWDTAADFDARGYLAYHQGRCAGFVRNWLREQGAPERLTGEVAALVGAHELGGWPDADLVQAADSLSFLETMVPLVERWITARGLAPSLGYRKLQWMDDRISAALPHAREAAMPLLEAGLSRLYEVAAETRRVS